jgi:predicted amidohydrolase YtcJ
MQTIFLSELGKNFRRYLDKDYIDRCYPVRSVLNHGILTALSSDGPVVGNINPLKGVEAAVTRKDNDGYPIAPQEAISIAEALKAYTASFAKINNTPQFGSLEAGKLADFIILSDDPLKTLPEKLADIKVEQTWIDGKVVYTA